MYCDAGDNICMRILLLEDHARFSKLLMEELQSDGHVIDLAPSAGVFEELIRDEVYELLIVDLSLPDGDGLNVIRSYRKRKRVAPIIIITARNSVADLVAGLDCGADDFLAKPFHIDVLRARIRAVLRRPRQLASQTQCVGRLTLCRESGTIRFEDGEIELSPSERRLLALLMCRAGSVVPKRMINGQIHGSENPNTPNAVEQLVSRLRKSLARSRSGVDVKTIRGVGYVLEEHAS